MPIPPALEHLNYITAEVTTSQSMSGAWFVTTPYSYFRQKRMRSWLLLRYLYSLPYYSLTPIYVRIWLLIWKPCWLCSDVSHNCLLISMHTTSIPPLWISCVPITLSCSCFEWPLGRYLRDLYRIFSLIAQKGFQYAVYVISFKLKMIHSRSRTIPIITLLHLNLFCVFSLRLLDVGSVYAAQLETAISLFMK